MRAKEILYVFENKYPYTGRPKNDWISITNEQYDTARRIIEDNGSRLNNPKTGLDNLDFLLEGCFIRLSGLNHAQGSGSTLTIQIRYENSFENQINGLVYRLNLPVPKMVAS